MISQVIHKSRVWVHSFETLQAYKPPPLQRNVVCHIEGNHTCGKLWICNLAFLSRASFRHLFASSKLLQSQSLYMISTPSRLCRFTQFDLQPFFIVIFMVFWRKFWNSAILILRNKLNLGDFTGFWVHRFVMCPSLFGQPYFIYSFVHHS